MKDDIYSILFQTNAIQMPAKCTHTHKHTHSHTRELSLPRLQNLPHVPKLLPNQIHMLLTPRRKLDLERQRSTNQLSFPRLNIELNLLSRSLINCMLDSERPKKPCHLAPLRTLGELDASADAAARAVIVVIAVFKVLASCIVPGEIGVVEIAVWVVGLWVFVLGMVEGPVWYYDGCIFGLELRVSRFEVWVCVGDEVTTYDEHAVVPVILCAAVGDASGYSVQE